MGRLWCFERVILRQAVVDRRLPMKANEGEGGADNERTLRSRRISKAAGDHARRESGDAAGQVENAKCSIQRSGEAASATSVPPAVPSTPIGVEELTTL